MDKTKLEAKKAWLEDELNSILKDLEDLSVKRHRFSGALGFVNDLIKELGDGELDVKKGLQEIEPNKRTINPSKSKYSA